MADTPVTPISHEDALEQITKVWEQSISHRIFVDGDISLGEFTTLLRHFRDDVVAVMRADELSRREKSA